MERKTVQSIDVAKVLQYLKDREKEDGGFSLVPDLYPDIADTYYAIRTLQYWIVESTEAKQSNT
jgi:hypothetical protein